jgi:two-component system NarL family sensor kinase
MLLQAIIVCAVQAQETPGKLIGSDTSAINKLLNHAYQLRETNTDSAGLLYRRALYVSKVANYRSGIADALCGLGRYYNIKNEQKTAVLYLNEAGKYFDRDKKGIEQRIASNLLLSESYFYLGLYDSCAFFRYGALDLVENNNIINPTLRLRVYSKILQFWLNAHEDIRHDKNIQQIMQHINEIERQALATSDSNLLVNIYFQKAGYYHNVSQNDSSRYYAIKNIELGRRLKVSPSMIMAAYLNMGITYIDDKKPDLAIQAIRSAVAAASAQGKANNRYLIFADILLGEAYNLKGQFSTAEALIAPALAQAKALNIISIVEHAHKTLADAYEGTGQYKNAAEQRKLYTIVKDSLMKAEKMELSYNLEMKYRISEKNKELAQKELAIVQQENKLKTKNTWIGGITAGLILISLLSTLLFIRNRHKQRIQSNKILALQKDMEIDRLKAMISGEENERKRIARDLHDGIGGTLGSIRGQLSMIFRKHKTSNVDKDFVELMTLLEEASSELRKTAHNLMPEILLQQGLAKATGIFCERVNKGHIVAINFETYGDETGLPSHFELTTYRIIQELVHNIVKHAEATEATVQLVFHDAQLCLTVEDNGKGMHQKGQQVTGMGMKTLKERVQSLDGQIDIESQPGKGTSVYIEFNIPAKKNIQEACT